MFARLVLVGLLMAPGLASAQALTGDQIAQQWSGKVLAGQLPKGGAVQMRLGADGSIEMSGASVRSGTWRPAPSGYCVTWVGQRENCFTAARESDGTIIVRGKNGVVLWRFTAP
jgi:hypothetical protein